MKPNNVLSWKLVALLLTLALLPGVEAQLLEGVANQNLVAAIVFFVFIGVFIYVLYRELGPGVFRRIYHQLRSLLQNVYNAVRDYLWMLWIIAGVTLLFIGAGSPFTPSIGDPGIGLLGLTLFIYGLSEAVAITQLNAYDTAFALRMAAVLVLVLWVMATFFTSFYSQLPGMTERAADTVTNALDEDVIRPLVCAGKTVNARMSCTLDVASNPSDFNYQTQVNTCIQRQLNNTECTDQETQSRQVSDAIQVNIEELATEGLPEEYRIESRFRYPQALDIDDRPIRRSFTDFTYAVSFNGESSNFVDAARIYTHRNSNPPDYFFQGVLQNVYATGNHNQIVNTSEQELTRLRPTQDVALRTIFTYENVSEEDDQTVHGDINNIQRGISAFTTVQQLVYTFNSTAAFTDTSRFREGDYTIKIWNQSAWNQQSFEERESWTNRNCDPVPTLGGGTIQRQRTAALTTPVTPVMYTGCSTFFFEEVADNQVNDQYHVPVTVSANAEKQTASGEVYFFEILDVDSNCFSDDYDAPNSIESDDTPEQEELQELVGRYYPEEDNALIAADRLELYTPVDVTGGETTQHTCNVQMRIRIGTERTGTGSTPNFLATDSGSGTEEVSCEEQGGTCEPQGPCQYGSIEDYDYCADSELSADESVCCQNQE